MIQKVSRVIETHWKHMQTTFNNVVHEYSRGMCTHYVPCESEERKVRRLKLKAERQAT